MGFLLQYYLSTVDSKPSTVSNNSIIDVICASNEEYYTQGAGRAGTSEYMSFRDGKQVTLTLLLWFWIFI